MINLKGCEVMNEALFNQALSVVEEKKKELDKSCPLTLLLKLRDVCESKSGPDGHMSAREAREVTEKLEEIIQLMVGPTLAQELIGGDR